MQQPSGDVAYTLTEQGTDQYADVSMAQRLAMAAVAQALATTIRTHKDRKQPKAEKERSNNHEDKN